MLNIGLTGGIGSGKTTVADLFAARGIALIDADLIAHRLTAPGGAAMPAIRAAFGDALLTPDGALARAQMRSLVFSDPSAKTRLEAILHPLIRQQADAQAARATSAYVIHVVPLLVESGDGHARFDRVLVVDCDETTQIARVIQRNGFTREQVLAIMAHQATRAARLAAADDVIRNEGDTASLMSQVDVLHNRYLEMARQSTRRL